MVKSPLEFLIIMILKVQIEFRGCTTIVAEFSILFLKMTPIVRKGLTSLSLLVVAIVKHTSSKSSTLKYTDSSIAL